MLCDRLVRGITLMINLVGANMVRKERVLLDGEEKGLSFVVHDIVVDIAN